MQSNNQMHPEDMRNLIIFAVLSIVLWLAYDHFVIKPQAQKVQAYKEAKIKAHREASPEEVADETERARNEVIDELDQIKINNGSIFGGLNLKGARIDDISLTRYHKTVERQDNVVIFSPSGSVHAKYAEYGWISEDDSIEVPDRNTVWKVANGQSTLSADQSITLHWTNTQGIRFEKDIALDSNYGFTVTQKIINNSGKKVTLFPYALIAERGLPDAYEGRWISFEGLIAYLDGKLYQQSYDDIKDIGKDTHDNTQGWIGITEKYWLTALVPDQKENVTFRFVRTPPKTIKGNDRYQVDITGQPRTIEKNETETFTTRLFAGAKKVSLLENYEKKWDVRHFDLAVDFGWFYFLTRPFFMVINFFYGLVGNFGIAIIMFTALLRVLVFPLANTSFKSFAGLKKLSPQMLELREKYGDDKQKLQQELVKLYQKEKVNPMAGCVPILIQIPIFFALFKVLSNTLEMRHQPFFGWIQDLSAPDPTSLFNAFGLIPWTPPSFLMIGIWPCLMLITMIIQRRLNPPPQDPLQAKMFAIMPYFITFILAKFAAGLVIYWTFNNIFSTIQQYIIMTRMGVKVDFFQRNKPDEKTEENADKADDSESSEETVTGTDDNTEEPKEISKPKPKKKKKR